MADGLDDDLLGHEEQEEQEAVSPWYHCLCPWMKKTGVQPAVQQNPVDLEEGALPPVVGPLVAASTSTAQALVIGVQGLAALLPILSNTHCGSWLIIISALLPLLGFLVAASADIFGLNNRKMVRLRDAGLYMVYAGYFSLAFLLLLACFSPGAFHSEGCFKSP